MIQEILKKLTIPPASVFEFSEDDMILAKLTYNIDLSKINGINPYISEDELIQDKLSEVLYALMKSNNANEDDMYLQIQRHLGKLINTDYNNYFDSIDEIKWLLIHKITLEEDKKL